MLLVVTVGAVAFVFWELSTVVRIVALTHHAYQTAAPGGKSPGA